MISTVTAEATHRGMRFQEGELETLGMTPGSTCWGLWVDSRDLPERSRLDTEAAWFNNQCPHLVVSPLHPNRWMTSFRLQALMERKEFDAANPPEHTSSLYGLCDALERCGVNVLYCNTALVGYDLFVLSATCELASLRPRAIELVAAADAEGVDLTRDRVTRPGASASREASAARARRDALSAIGRLMLQRLADLEARLRLIDICRYRASERTDSNDLLRALPPEDPLVRVVGGERAEGMHDALAAPWYCHRRTVVRENNPYFIVDAPSPITPPSVDGVGLLNDADRGHLYDHLRAGLTDVARRATAEGLGSADASYDPPSLIRRAASPAPIRVTPSPFLAYARCWALWAWQRYANVNTTSASPFIEFRYDGRSLLPMVEKLPNTYKSTAQICSFLNSICGCDSTSSPRGVFGHDSRILAALHTPDRFMRLRFVRDRTDQTTCCRVAIPFNSIDHDLNIRSSDRTSIPSSHGLLARCTRILAEAHFRIEKLSIQFDALRDDVESGVINIIAQATSRQGAIALGDLTRIQQLRQRLSEAVPRSREGAKLPSVTIEPGMS